MLAVCMTLIDNDKDQTSFEDFYYRNRQIAYAFAYKILNNSALAEEACANAFFSIAKCFKKIHNYSLHDMDAYLIRTIRNACYAIYNKENQNPTSSIFDLKVEDEPSEDFYDDIDLDLLIDAVRKLDDKLNYTFSFGDIIDTQEDSDGRILSYFGTDSITPVQLREVLDKLDDNSKASMPGMYFGLMFDQDELKIDECFDGGQPYLMSAVRIQYDEELNDYSLYESYVDNMSIRKGRYFTKEEYASNENLVVLPSGAKDDMIGKNVELLGKSYKVIGIFGNTVQEEFQVPFKTLGDNCTISSISFLDDNALDTESFFKLKKAFSEVLTCNVNFPPIDTIDMAEIKFYNSVIFMSVAVAIASAINLAMLFRYIIRSRAKQTAIFMLCGCTSNKIRRMYIAEIGMISVTIYVIFALVFNYAAAS